MLIGCEYLFLNIPKKIFKINFIKNIKMKRQSYFFIFKCNKILNLLRVFKFEFILSSILFGLLFLKDNFYFLLNINLIKLYIA